MKQSEQIASLQATVNALLAAINPPVVAQPVVAQPVVAQPVVAQPVVAQPVKPCAILTDAAIADVADGIVKADAEASDAGSNVLKTIVSLCARHAHNLPIDDSQVDAILSRVALAPRFVALKGTGKTASAAYRARMSDLRAVSRRYYDVPAIEAGLAGHALRVDQATFKACRMLVGGKASSPADACAQIIAHKPAESAPPADWAESSKRIGKALRAIIDLPHAPDGFEIAVRTLAATWRIDMPAKKITK